ncbi:MAG: PHP domain-containing protein [Clostridia bacterium]|nr:PHP domain-containing protein [Clostridia bacterium]
MQQICDLHAHSHFSDGTDSPTQLLQKAQAAGISALALTDHNTVAGLPEFLAAAEGSTVTAVPGVEISTEYNNVELHIVGLFLKPAYWAQVTDYLATINIRKEQSSRALIKSLCEAGYPLDYDEVKAQHHGVVNRAVIAGAMLQKGYITTIGEAFRGLLSETNGVYVPPKRIPSLEAVDFLRSVQAVPVLAHPFLNLGEADMVRFIQLAKPCGLAAMETLYSTYSDATTADAQRIAQTCGLLQSGGSDYHGGPKPDIALGTGRGSLAVPLSICEALREYHGMGSKT